MDTTTVLQYGYGHTVQASKLVKETLKKELKKEIYGFNLKISVKAPDSNYGGPRVKITTSDTDFIDQYEYIINDEDGQIGNGPGVLCRRPITDFPDGRPSYLAKLIHPVIQVDLDKKINYILSQFGKDNSDIMTDYFDNTQPLFYGVEYRKEG